MIAMLYVLVYRGKHRNKLRELARKYCEQKSRNKYDCWRYEVISHRDKVIIRTREEQVIRDFIKMLGVQL